jgi:hypothetical protein
MDDNQEITSLLSLYKDALKLFESYICINSIHGDSDLCVNASHREILYAIEKCFNMSEIDENGNPVKIAFYREKMLGKNVQVSFINLPAIPPFEDIMKYYKKYYLQRLTLLNLHYEANMIDLYNNGHGMEVLNYKKYKLEFDNLSSDYSQLLYLPLPMDIIKTIYTTYLEYSFDDYQLLRKNYDKLRKCINSKGPLAKGDVVGPFVRKGKL